jgi:hypothetical protein
MAALLILAHHPQAQPPGLRHFSKSNLRPLPSKFPARQNPAISLCGVPLTTLGRAYLVYAVTI